MRVKRLALILGVALMLGAVAPVSAPPSDAIRTRQVSPVEIAEIERRLDRFEAQEAARRSEQREVADLAAQQAMARAAEDQLKFNIKSDSGIDWPAWVQAVGAFIAIAVTAAQWWFTHQQLRTERTQRARHTQVVLSGVYVALRQNITFIRAEYERAGEQAPRRFASAMVSTSTSILRKVMSGIDLANVPPENLDAVMSAQTCFDGIMQALEDLAGNEQVEVPLAVDYLEQTIQRFRFALKLSKPEIPDQALD